MLIRLRDLTALSVTDGEGGKHHVTDLLVDDNLAVTHVLTRLGRWLDQSGCAMRADAFGAPDLADGSWPVKVSEADVRAGAGGSVALLCDPDQTPDPAEVAAAEGSGPLHALSAIDEVPVEDNAGKPVGKVMDFIIDADARKVAMIVLHAGATGVEHQRAVPAAMAASVDWEAGGVRLGCPASAVDDAPDLHELNEKVEGHWYNRVLAYYGVG